MSAPGRVWSAASGQWVDEQFATAQDLDRTWVPAHNKLLAATCDPATATANLTLSAGFVWFNKIWLPETISVTTLQIGLQVAGSSLTAGQNFGGIYDAAGNLIAKTADQATAWQSGGFKSMALTAESGFSLTLPGGPGVWIYGALLANGSTAPQAIMRPSPPSAVMLAANLNLSAADGLRAAFSSTGSRTALPATVPALAFANDPYIFFMGVS